LKLSNLRNYAVELLMKGGLSIDEIEFSDRRGSRFNCGQLLAEIFSQSHQNPGNLSRFSLLQRLQLIVGLDCCQRLDKRRRTGGRISMRNSGHARAMVRLN